CPVGQTRVRVLQDRVVGEFEDLLRRWVPFGRCHCVTRGRGGRLRGRGTLFRGARSGGGRKGRCGGGGLQQLVVRRGRAGARGEHVDQHQHQRQQECPAAVAE